MFAMLSIPLGFAIMTALLWALDLIAIHRGLGGAHPLSPAVAWTALLGTLLMIGLFVAGTMIDRTISP